MRVLLVNRFWADGHVPTGRMLFDVARVLVNEGHSVAVLTSADSYVKVSGEMPNLDRLEVFRIKSFGPRILRWIVFWIVAVIRPLFMHWDRCVVLTDPPFMNFFSIWDSWVHKNKRKRFWWVMDLFPDMASASGVIKKRGALDRLLRRLTNVSLNYLDGVVVLDQAQERRLSRYPNWSTAENFSIRIPPWDFRKIERGSNGSNKFLKLMNFSNQKIILYAGNLGRAHVFEPLVEAAKELAAAGQDEWTFVFACRGFERKNLERAATGVSNIRIIDYVPPDITSDMLFAAGAHVITLKKEWEGICVPSKLYGIMPTGKPVLFLGSEESGTAQEILKQGSGVVLPPDAKPKEIIQALERILSGQYDRLYSVDRTGPVRIAHFITT